MVKQYFDHNTIEGDRWDLLAYKYYGDAHKFNLIKNANPSVKHRLILEGNLTLKIPIIEADDQNNNLLPPWKRS